MSTTAPLENLICSFSPNCNQFVACTSDSRLRVFNTLTGTQQAEFQGNITVFGASEQNGVVENGNSVIEQINSVTIIQPDSKGSEGQSFLASCGASGWLRVYDLTDPQLLFSKRTHNSEGNMVSNFNHSDQKKSVEYISVGQDGQISVLNYKGKVVNQVKTEFEKLSAVCVCDQNKVVLLGTERNLVLGQIEGEKKQSQLNILFEFPGHTAPASCMKFVPGVNVAVSGSRGELGLTFWDVETPSELKKKKTIKKRKAIGNLVMNDYPVSIDVIQTSENQNQFHVLCVSSVGEVCIWKCSVKVKNEDEDSKKHKRKIKNSQICKIKMKESDGRNFVLAAKFESESVVKIAKGLSSRPVFESVQINQGMEILVEINSQGVIIQNKKEKTLNKKQGERLQGDITFLGNTHTQDALIQPKVLDSKDAVDQKGLKRTWQQFIDETTNELDSGESDEIPELKEPTLEQRIQQIQGIKIVQGGANSTTPEEVPIPKGGAVVDTLKQALRSNDQDLLNKCLHMATGRAMHTTIAMLQPDLAMEFVNQLVKLFQNKLQLVSTLSPWIQTVLQYHALQLMSSDRISHILTILHQSIEGLLNMHKSMLQLQGRLDLLLAQVKDDDKNKSGGMEELLPTVQYDESDLDEGVEIEDPFQLNQKQQLLQQNNGDVQMKNGD